MKVILFFSILIFTNLRVHPQSYTIDDILSMPYCTDLISSKKGQKVAWVSTIRGIREIYVAEYPSFKPKNIFRSQGDDGQILSNLMFSPDEEWLYFGKGSAPNRQGEIANPSSLVKYPERGLFRINLTTNKIDTVGNYNQYVISPDGEYLLILDGNTLNKVSLRDKILKEVIKMRGTFSDVVFSSTGEKILFVSNRGDHSFIGTYLFGDQHIKWISPSIYNDAYPAWNNDGTKITFIRSPGTIKGQLADITGGHPFQIMIYDLVDEKITAIWSSPGDDGGFSQYYNSTPIQWSNSGEIIFYSEHEGWMKLYALDPSNGKISALLDGDCEIEHSHLSNQSHQLIFSTNCDDIDRRDLYTYDLMTRDIRQVTDGDDIETNPLILKDGIIAFRKSSFNNPTHIVIKSGQDDRSISEMELGTFPTASHVVPKQVVFQSGDGIKIHGQLFTNEEGGLKPGVLFMHGGPIRQMLLGYHYSSYYANAYAFNQYLASQGYVVLSVNYRAGIGYGRSFRRAEYQGPRGASEYQDIVAAAHYLQTLDNVDADRIGLWGGSYGGLLTAQGLARNSDLFKAGVDFHGVHDWAWRATDFSEGGFWGITEDLLEEAYESSPVADIDTWKSPVLMIHGDDDRNVMFGQTIDLVQRLNEKGVHTEVLVLPDEVHGFYRYDSWLRAYRATEHFFNRFLKD